MKKITVKVDLDGEDVGLAQRCICHGDEELTASALFVFVAERLLVKAREEKDVVRLYDGYGFHLQFDINMTEDS